ncbi:MAG: GrpB family protein [Candidatus Dormibacteria bacterium]
MKRRRAPTPGPDQSEAQLRGWLGQTGREGWRGAPNEPGPLELWAELHQRFGRRVTLLHLYRLAALAQGTDLDGLGQSTRGELAQRMLRLQWPGFATTDVPRREPEPIRLQTYDPSWARTYQDWEARLRAALGNRALAVEHVGSTAVAGLAAKPVVDIQLSVADIEDEPAYAPELAEVLVPVYTRDAQHRFCVFPTQGLRQVHLHVCNRGGRWEREHLLFRDYLRSSPDACRAYARVKRRASRRWRDDRAAYTDAKSEFILDTMEEAELWAEGTGWRLA